MTTPPLFAFHLIGAAFTNYMIYWYFTNVPGKPFIENAVQLTVITLMLISVYYMIVLVQDIRNMRAKSENKSPVPYGQKTYLLFQTVFSLAHLVATGYWALRIYDITLVVPESELDAVDWRSSYAHGLNLIPLYVELAFFVQIMPKGRIWKIIHYTEFTIFYIVLQFLYNALTEKHVYPFLESLPMWVVGGFYGSLFLFMLIVDIWGCFLISSFHGHKIRELNTERTESLVKNKSK